MKVGLVAVHYPRPEHRDEMISRVHQAAEVMGAAPGCLAVGCWLGEGHQAVVITGQWESEQALAAAFSAVRAAGIDFDYDERESRPREVTNSSPHKRAAWEAAVTKYSHQSVCTTSITLATIVSIPLPDLARWICHLPLKYGYPIEIPLFDRLPHA